MSLCYDYDFQKWTILSLGLVAATLIVGLVILVEHAYGLSDFNLEAKVNPNGTSSLIDPVPYLYITKFEFQGNNSICPSIQCKTDYKDKATYFSPPVIPEKDYLSIGVGFRLQDDITHANLGEKKKELVEQYEAAMTCNIVDIVEKNGQEVYYCNTGVLTYIFNKFNSSKTWPLNITGIYDAKKQTLKISGNLTGMY